MKHLSKVILALLLLGVFYLSQGFFQLRQELFKVYDVPDIYTYGNSDADLVIVDFNRFGCQLCHTLHPILVEAIKQDGNILYIPRTVTHGQLWEEKLVSAVYAAAEQGKFFEMHNMIYKKWPIENKAMFFELAAGLGLDTKQLSRDMERPDIIERVRENQKFFDEWGLSKTPTLLIGKKAIYMPSDIMPTVEELLEKFKKVRP